MRYITLAIMTMALSSCGEGTGTGTGNPLDSGAVSDLTSAYVFGSACQLLKKCNSVVTDDACAFGLVDVKGFGPKLGVSDPDLTARQIMTLENTHQITPNGVEANKCVAQMLKLPCSDSRVQQAYDPASPQPFAKTPEILDSPSCVRVFGGN